ncbi:mercury resistance system substrate-binding protein MerP [Effusibacillus consociatus]|uniref:Mercury resistance system substrate-binding protein MerP n=1 Tax=Effusibacillus consociatus TaxID=1117041 RepID=A0ABV9PXA2_9BACL
MKTMGIMVIASVLLLSTACAYNEKSAATVKTTNTSTVVASQTATFTVTGLECCPPSVVQDLISEVTGVIKVDVEPKGSTGKVTVSFDDKKTDVKQIKTSITKYGFGIIGG